MYQILLVVDAPLPQNGVLRRYKPNPSTFYQGSAGFGPMPKKRETFNLRMNDAVWEDLEAYCKRYGLSLNGAIEAFVRTGTAGFAMMQKLAQVKDDDT